MEKINKISLSRLTGKEIHEKVRKGKMTLRELAKEYDCSYDEFLKKAEEKVGKKEWRHVLKASERNAKMKRKNDGAPKKEHKGEEKKKHLQKEFLFPKSEKPQAVQQVMPKSPIIKQYLPKRPLEEIQKDLVWVDELLGSAQMVHEDCLKRWERFCQKTDAALKAYESSVQRTLWANVQKKAAGTNCVKNQEVLSYFELLVQNNLKEQELNFRCYAELVGLRQMSQADVLKAKAAVSKYQMRKEQLMRELSEVTSAD